MNNLDITPKEIAWNGLRLEIPPQWEVIVSGKNHLLFEVDFHPVLELRWDTSTTTPKDNRTGKILKNLQKELELPVVEISPPANLQNNLEKYQTTWLSWRDDRLVTGAILLCRACNTLLLLRLHDPQNAGMDSPVAVLQSLNCHAAQDLHTPWAIQDFRVQLPDAYTLLHYNLAAGFTRLTFSSPGTLLHICRIAPAGERLKQQTLPNILKTLLNTSFIEENVAICDHTVEYQRRPTIFTQIIVRLRRQKPFCWARIWHCKDTDRLLAVVMESIRPIDMTTAQEICKTYAILPST